MATQPEIIDAIQAGINRVESTFGQLNEAQLNTQIHDGSDGWTARQILAHLANRQPTYDVLVSTALKSSGAPPAGFSIDSWNQKLVEERARESVSALLREFNDVHEGLIRQVESLRDDQLSLPLVLPNRETNLGDVLLGSAGMHSIQHAREVEVALGIEHE